ncbi:hypothetical protein J6590_056430 [Homalodisca vitripennis]|nr:hypothetical protein J6590_056430 [Homalodisca vitripennis]
MLFIYKRLLSNDTYKPIILFVNFCTKIPKVPFVLNYQSKDSTISFDNAKIDFDTINHLERLSLVNFGNVKGIEILESSIAFANQLFKIDTTGVKPLTTVLENRILALRDDVVTEGGCRKTVMANAKLVEEEYFVAPPGNIPLEPKNQEVIKEQLLKRKN